MLRQFHEDESGVVVSAELILIVTIIFCSTAVGWSAVRSAVTHELDDLSDAVGVVSQSYNVTGIRKSKNTGKPHGECSGFGFNDRQDDCDCRGLLNVTTCGKTQYNSSVRENQ